MREALEITDLCTELPDRTERLSPKNKAIRRKNVVANDKQLKMLLGNDAAASVDIRNGYDLDLAPLDATFRDSGQAPLHSWFPYLEGYSPRFVERVRHEYLPKATRIIEPFAGTGTTPIVLTQAGISCAFSEANPAMAFIAQTKLAVLRLPVEKRSQLTRKITKLAQELPHRIARTSTDEKLRAAYTRTFGDSVFFNDDSLGDILKLRTE